MLHLEDLSACYFSSPEYELSAKKVCVISFHVLGI